MYTVVIVDDEPWALQGLAETIDWNNEGFSIIGQFTDPGEAFEFLCKKEPDVVFTDIRMPGLSGLDLIEMSRVKGLNCEFVLISSYEDFEAAQKGIRLHVWEYILKPYNAEDIHPRHQQDYLAGESQYFNPIRQQVMLDMICLCNNLISGKISWKSVMDSPEHYCNTGSAGIFFRFI